MSFSYITPTGQVRRVAAIDAARIAEAFRNKPRSEHRAAPATLLPAPSAEGCARCGIPGRKGCAHQSPFEPTGLGISGARARVGCPTGKRT